MAIPTPVNGQITDAVTQANVKVLGDAPAMAMGAIYQSLAHSTGILYENAASSQQQLAIAAQAATNQGVIQIYSVDTMAGAVATSKIAQSDTPDNMLSLLTALRAVGRPGRVRRAGDEDSDNTAHSVRSRRTRCVLQAHGFFRSNRDVAKLGPGPGKIGVGA